MRMFKVLLFIDDVLKEYEYRNEYVLCLILRCIRVQRKTFIGWPTSTSSLKPLNYIPQNAVVIKN